LIDYSFELDSALACNSAPCLKMSERNMKNSPVEREIDALTSNFERSVENHVQIATTIAVAKETATAMMIEAIPRRKLSLLPSKVKGVPALRTFAKYRSAKKAKTASPTQVMSPEIQAAYPAGRETTFSEKRKLGRLFPTARSEISPIPQPTAPMMQRIKTTLAITLTTLKTVKMLDNVLLIRLSFLVLY